MQPRMTNPALMLPDVMQALQNLSKATQKAGVPPRIRLLVHLRASQINGCSVCVAMHARELRQANETDDRLFTVAAWREAPYFSDAERAALELTESLTRIADRPDPVPDAVYDAAARHFDEKTLGALIVEIAMINVWNRLNVATRQIAGSYGR